MDVVASNFANISGNFYGACEEAYAFCLSVLLDLYTKLCRSLMDTKEVDRSNEDEVRHVADGSRLL